MRGVKASDNAYTNTILDNARKSGELVPKTEMKQVSDEDLLGGLTPNDLMKIDQKDVNTIREKYEDTYFDEILGRNKDYLSKEERDSLKAIAFNEEVYVNNRKRPEVLDRLFTKEEQVVIENKLAIEKKMNEEIGKLLGMKELGKDDLEYVRYVLSPLLSKNAKPSDLRFDFWGTGERQYASYADAVKDLSLAKRIGASKEGGKVNKADVDRLSSILKTKMQGLDMYRYHSPTLRMIDYAREVGTLKRNEDIVKVFEDLSKVKDPKVKEQLNAITKKGSIEALLSLGEPTGIGKRSAQQVSGLLLAANPVPAIQAATSSGIRAGIVSGVNKLTSAIAGVSKGKPQNVVQIGKELGIDTK